jgi:hypothetical protein
MASFADITTPQSRVYSSSSWNTLGYQVQFIGDQFLAKNRIVNGNSWSRIVPTVLSESSWQKPSTIYINKNGSWEMASDVDRNTNRVTKVTMWAYAYLPPVSTGAGACPRTPIFSTGDGGATLSFSFPYTVPAGWRLTKFRSLNAKDDYVSDIRFQNRSDTSASDFVLATSGNPASFNTSCVSISPSTLGGLHHVHILDKYQPTIPTSCGGDFSGAQFTQKKLGSRFVGNLAAEFPVMPASQTGLWLRGAQPNCKNCEARVYFVFMEFHSGNAITNDNGATWIAPQTT